MGWSSNLLSRFASFIHAFNVSAVAIFILLTRSSTTLWNPGYIEDEMWSNMFILTYQYLAVDLALMLIFPTPGDRQFIIHHIFGGLGIFLIWYMKQCWLIGLIFELTELSSVFLNITWYLHKSIEEDAKNNLPPNLFRKKLFYQAGVCLLISFFLTRIVGGGVIVYYIYNNYDFIMTIPWFNYIYLLVGSSIISCLNIFWFYKLLAKLTSQM